MFPLNTRGILHLGSGAITRNLFAINYNKERHRIAMDRASIRESSVMNRNPLNVFE
jgi:hypothetical protein